MSDEIKDLDDVEAIVWAVAYASGVRWSESYPGRLPVLADECVRLLRERRHTRPHDESDRLILGERDR